MAGLLDRSRTIAPADYNRWLIPPCALAIHLCIGQVYAFSVFNEPLSRLLGVDAPAPGDWSLATLGWVFSIAIAFLGLTAAAAGTWVERAGPRKAMFASAMFWASGFLVGAAGVALHNLVLLYFGYGVLGGIGLGLGYISPVKTLIRWFPDRPGMATGLAIMGFGGGAMIGSPLAVSLMNAYATPDSVGVAPAFVTMGLIYLAFMLVGAFTVKVPADGWAPAGWTAPVRPKALVTSGNVDANTAIRTRAFWLVWVVLCVNVTAGIGVLGQASVMSQEMVGVSAAAAAGFVGLLSLANMGGRFAWASLSDIIGRRTTYSIFFTLGIVLYAAVPSLASLGVAPFVIAYLLILTMYGGGFATVPAYLRDLFGTEYVGAIHGRLLTAWSVAGVLGPVLVNYLREAQIDAGVAPAQAYSLTMYVMAGLLAVGLACNLAIRPVAQRRHIASEAGVAAGGA
jgi:MFS family permease